MTAKNEVSAPARARRSVGEETAPAPLDDSVMNEPIGNVVGKEADAEYMEEVKSEKHVDVIVPKAFMLTDDHHVIHHIPAGFQSMPKSWFDHFYVQAHGVTLAPRGKKSEDE